MKNKFEIVTNYGDNVQFDSGKFSGGEIRVKVKLTSYIPSVTITAHIFSSDDLMTLVMLTDAIRRCGTSKINLVMPYIPYARQDRVCNYGESLSIKVFTDIINSLNFASVTVYDPHSDVSSVLLNNVIVRDQLDITLRNPTFQGLFNRVGKKYLVSPDAGALKKIYKIAQHYNTEVIVAEKIRDVSTGAIVKTVVRDLPDDVDSASLFIIDDIIDGGRTFLELGKILKPTCKELNLFATHGIFSQGIEVFEPYFDNVMCEINFKDFA